MPLDEHTEVVLVPKYYLPTLGGLQNFSARLASALATRGHPVTVCFPRAPAYRAAMGGPPEPAGVTVCPLSEDRSIFWKVLPDQLRRLRPGALVLAVGLEYAEVLDEQLSALLRLRETGLRVWMRIATTGDFESRVDPRRAERMARLSGLVVLNEAMKRETAAFPDVDRRTRRIPVMVDTLRYVPRPEAAREVLRAHRGLPRTGRILLAATRLDPRKRLDLLIMAFASAAPPSDTLWIVGDDPTPEGLERQRLEALSRRLGLTRVVFTRGVTEDQMPQILAAADAFATASSVEGMSNAVLEAASVGLPVMGFAIPGVEDVSSALRGAGFFLAPPDSGIPGLADVLRQGLHPASVRCWRSAREQGLQHLSIDAVVDAYLDAFREEVHA
ncbi:glycosyltransferase family 4 protein [Corallococcus carmarthensis]|uniref:Glycosyltransferase n=1 Tax=Corallococcus carmarthensis TaxID=2316728 RepID=A0A3A8K7A1_9BACT|nr:glycosyltransferase family 4 protein [Corallococcus carmarthensis]RKG97663.1 glycosyltransferase [Corallococcus carmarthensis]